MYQDAVRTIWTIASMNLDAHVMWRDYRTRPEHCTQWRAPNRLLRKKKATRGDSETLSITMKRARVRSDASHATENCINLLVSRTSVFVKDNLCRRVEKNFVLYVSVA